MSYDNTDEKYPKLHRLPKGCDYQGRYPQAAEAATDIGQDEEYADRVILWAAVAIVTVTLIAIGVAIWGS